MLSVLFKNDAQQFERYYCLTQYVIKHYLFHYIPKSGTASYMYVYNVHSMYISTVMVTNANGNL